MRKLMPNFFLATLFVSSLLISNVYAQESVSSSKPVTSFEELALDLEAELKASRSTDPSLQTSLPEGLSIEVREWNQNDSKAFEKLLGLAKATPTIGDSSAFLLEQDLIGLDIDRNKKELKLVEDKLAFANQENKKEVGLVLKKRIETLLRHIETLENFQSLSRKRFESAYKLSLIHI